MGVIGKELMRVALDATKLVELTSYNLEQLQRRAEQQVGWIETERISAIRHALAGAIRSR